MLSLAQDDGRRIWVILDDLPTLHQVPSVRPGLAESRQFGGCFVLGVQVFSALRDFYRRKGAENISGLSGTRVMLAAPDRAPAIATRRVVVAPSRRRARVGKNGGTMQDLA